MSKLAPQDKFFDLSDYGRLPATIFAQQLKKTAFTPIHVTLLFGVVGLLAAFCILKGYFWQAGVLLILKSIIDAADGELARIKNTPSYTGRYLDSVFDFILNFIFLICIDYTFKIPLWITLGAFVSIELQGTLYNYYYLILRYISIGGDVTSKIFEVESPVAFPNEEQKWVNLLFFFYTIFYRIYDKIIHIIFLRRRDGDLTSTPYHA